MLINQINTEKKKKLHFINSTLLNQLDEAPGNTVMTFSWCKQCLVHVWLIFCKRWRLLKIETSLLFNPLACEFELRPTLHT